MTLKRKVEAAATFPDDPGIIRNVRQRLYCSLAIRKDRDVGEMNTVRKDPLCDPVDGHYLRLEYAAIFLQPE